MNYFNYEGWVGCIIGRYSSISEFPDVGSEGCVYVIVSDGKALSYVWDEGSGSYLELTGSIEGGLKYKGTVAQESELPLENEPGDVFIASAEFVLTGGEAIEVGDMLIWDGSKWNVIQSNIDGAVTGPTSSEDENIAVFDGTTGKIIKDSGKKIPEPAEEIKAGETGYATGGQVYDYVEEHGFDISRMETETAAAKLNQAQADWNQSDETAADYIKNKPQTAASIAEGETGYTTGDQVYDYVEEHGFNIETMETETASASLNQVQADWNQDDDTAADYIKNKPQTAASIADGETGYTTGDQVYDYVEEHGFNIGTMETEESDAELSQVQADWNQDDTTAADYIKNKPQTAASIADGETGYTTGDQVYDYVAENGFNPSSIQELSGGVVKLPNSEPLVAQIQAVETELEASISSVSSAKMDKVTTAIEGNFVAFDSNGNASDSGKNATDFLPEPSQMEIPATSASTLELVGMEGIQTILESL